MSYTAIIDDGKDIQVASNGGWYEFCDWVRGLDEETCPDLAGLVDEGHAEDLDELADQLGEAIEDCEPPPTVEATAHGLLEFVEANRGGEVIVVTQGFED